MTYTSRYDDCCYFVQTDRDRSIECAISRITPTDQTVPHQRKSRNANTSFSRCKPWWGPSSTTSGVRTISSSRPTYLQEPLGMAPVQVTVPTYPISVLHRHNTPATLFEFSMLQGAAVHRSIGGWGYRHHPWKRSRTTCAAICLGQSANQNAAMLSLGIGVTPVQVPCLDYVFNHTK